MDRHALEKIRSAVAAAEQAARAASLDSCDMGDIDEAIEAVSRQLARPHPSSNLITLYVNSIARSLIGIPDARDAIGQIDTALREAGLPVTWEQ